MQQRIATGKSSLYSTKFHIVLQNTSNIIIYSKEYRIYVDQFFENSFCPTEEAQGMT